MEATTIVYWAYIGIMENKMETTMFACFWLPDLLMILPGCRAEDRGHQGREDPGFNQEIPWRLLLNYHAELAPPSKSWIMYTL